MNSNTPFIFQPSKWHGNGTIILSESPELIHFDTEWTIAMHSDFVYSATQVITTKDVGELNRNHYLFTQTGLNTFTVLIENHFIAKVSGSGMFQDGLVGWGFFAENCLQGHESYQKYSDELISFIASYQRGEMSTTIYGTMTRRDG